SRPHWDYPGPQGFASGRRRRFCTSTVPPDRQISAAQAIARGSVDLPPERRQGIENGLAVALGHQAPVEYGDGAAVLLGAQQPAASLDQLERGIRHGYFHEGVAAARL